MNILCIESFCLQRTHNRTLLFGSTLLKHGLHFDYWNQPLNMCMRIWHLDCHEDGLCCYLVIHIENLLRPLQLFYFHLWPIYSLSFILSFRVFTHSVHTNTGILPQLPDCHFLPHSSHSSFNNQTTSRHIIFWETDSVVKYVVSTRINK
jgi:hypothetical protein